MISSFTSNIGLASEKTLKQKQKFNTFEQYLKVDNTRSTTPNMKSADHSMMAQTFKCESRNAPLLNKAKQLK